MTDNNRKEVLEIMTNLQIAHDRMKNIPETYARDEAYKLIEQAHEATSKLLLSRS